jgi:hypothetical protein
MTYADAITVEEEDALIAQNEESVKLSLEASLRFYLVDYFPLRTYGPGQYLRGANCPTLKSNMSLPGFLEQVSKG